MHWDNNRKKFSIQSLCMLLFLMYCYFWFFQM